MNACHQARARSDVARATTAETANTQVTFSAEPGLPWTALMNSISASGRRNTPKAKNADCQPWSTGHARRAGSAMP